MTNDMTSEELLASAELGDQALRFRDSELGKCILGMAEQDARDAAAKLARVNPTDASSISQFQVDYKVAERFEQYLMELITDGEQSIQIFKQQEYEKGK